MTLRALIVEDDPPTSESLQDLLCGLQHEADIAENMEDARRLLEQHTYTYIILDMAIPVRPGRFPQRETGRLLLEEIRRNDAMVDLPVLVLTGEDHGDSDFIRAVTRAGGYEPPKLEYVQKPTVILSKGELNHETLTRKITGLLSARPGVLPPAPSLRPTSAFSSATRTLTIYRHRIDVCGVQIWGETESCDMRTALLNLNKRDQAGRYRAVRGTAVVPGRNASNPVGSMVERFRKSATTRLREDRDLDCGPEDIIANERRKGYFLREWVVVEEVDAEGPDDSALATSALCDAGAADAASCLLEMAAPAASEGIMLSSPIPLTDRQRAILTIMASTPIAQKELLVKAKVSKATLNRDLSAMREAGLFTVGADNLYFLTENGRASL